MNRLEKVLKTKKNNLLAIYLMAGYPEPEDTVSIINALDKAGADIIEIGFPFSDPLADGTVIQHASEVAINNGMSLQKLFVELAKLPQIRTPLVLMGYLNPVLRMGIDAFLNACRECNVSGFILPDMPLDFYENMMMEKARRLDIHAIFMVTPGTPDERILKIKSLSRAFVYVTSDYSLTGGNVSVENRSDYFRRVSELLGDVPFLIGFGIDGRENFRKACKYASGAVIGTAFLRHLEQNSAREESIREFITNILS